MEITLLEVKNKKDLCRFVDYPAKLYAGCRYWVPSLRGGELRTLGRRNPSMEFCKLRLVLAFRGKEIVGRIAGIINPLANEKTGKNVVRFGWIDFIDDIEVVRLLTDDIARWGRKEGMSEMKGPVGFTNMDKSGLLVEGFDTMASFTCIYNYPYYHTLLSELGFEKDVDWTSKVFEVPSVVPDRLVRMTDIIQRRYGFHLFKPRCNRELIKKGTEMFNVLNEAWVHIYGSSPLNDKQIKESMKSFAPVMDKRFVAMVLDNEENIIGFGVCIPFITPAIKKCGGRLLPFGFISLLKAMRKCDTVEALLIGVLPKYQGMGVSSIITRHLQQNFIDNGIKTLLANPQLEDNLKVQNVFSKDYSFTWHSRRRSYTKEI